jgi:folate-dependent phosphoribosylglycinamide formyltransferase PurN
MFTLKKHKVNKMKVSKWAVFVSQTGSEVVELSEALGLTPGYLFTNNYSKLASNTLKFLKENNVEVIKLPFRPTEDDYQSKILNKCNLLTLHGYLRILPASFIRNFKGSIYNGHPGLISSYPELKGKDPQIKAWEGKYREVGSVVHKVTEGVDEGDIVMQCSTNNFARSLDGMYRILKSTSFTCWVSFLLKSKLLPLGKETIENLEFEV